MGDDIGYWNISVYNRGMMAYRTPNIDRIANEGAIFTDYRGQQPCTAGRAAFITGQSPLRTELPKVGLPGAKEGLSAQDPQTRASITCKQNKRWCELYARAGSGNKQIATPPQYLLTAPGVESRGSPVPRTWRSLRESQTVARD